MVIKKKAVLVCSDEMTSMVYVKKGGTVVMS